MDLDATAGRLVMGAAESGRPGGGIAGRAFQYEYDETTDAWLETDELTYSERAQHGPNTYVDFGRKVALWDNGAIVSAPLAPSDDGTQAVGKVYVFEDSFGTSYCPGTTFPSGQPAQLAVSGSNVLPHAGWQLSAEGQALGDLSTYANSLRSSRSCATVSCPVIGF